MTPLVDQHQASMVKVVPPRERTIGEVIDTLRIIPEKAADIRDKILEKSNENMALAHKHLKEGLDWLGVMDADKARSYKKLTDDVGELLGYVEELRKYYVHTP